MNKLLLTVIASLFLLPLSAQIIENGVLSSCQGLTGEYVMPDDVEEVAPYAFMTSTITKVTFSPNVKKVGDLAFAFCGKLLEVVIPPTCKVKYFGNQCFSECEMLKRFIFPNSVNKIGDNFFFLCTGLSEAILPAQLDTIPQHMFQSCKSLREISLPPSLKVISNNAFAGCSNLDDLVMPSVDSIATKAFLGCEALKEIHLPDNIRAIADSAFMRCERLRTLRIPKSLKYIGARISRKCYKLEKFIVDPENPNFMDIDGVLYAKDKTVLYECPARFISDNYQVPNEVKKLYPGCFFECINVKQITIPSTVERIGLQALCFNGMERFNYGGSERYKIIDNALYFYKDGVPAALMAYPTMNTAETHKVPDGTKLITSYALVGNEFLVSVKFPTSLLKLDTCAMMNMTKLKEITVAKNSPPSTSEGNFDGIHQPKVTCLIPSGSFQSYVSNGLWQYFLLKEDEKVVEDNNIVVDYKNSMLYIDSEHQLLISNPTIVKVIDSSGKEVLIYQTTVPQERIDLSFLSKGLYVAIDGTTRNYKFIR